jgi:hypothetical protein
MVLNNPTGSLYDDLKHTLLGKYGVVFAHTLDPNVFHNEQTEWHSGDTRIALNKIGGGPNEPPFVSIVYDPLVDANNGGL